ncbi:MAG: ABC transporter permease subunit, partial [Treponema sp.]|nr:ABC transporter permease subunit [Treponema sp.]
MLKIILYTLEIAIFSTLLAALIGIPVAFFTSHRRFLGQKLLLSASIVPLCVPPLIVALGYVSFFGISGTANSFLKLLGFSTGDNKTFLYSTAGIIIAQGFYNFPLITKIMNDAWTRLPKEQENA